MKQAVSVYDWTNLAFDPLGDNKVTRLGIIFDGHLSKARGCAKRYVGRQLG